MLKFLGRLVLVATLVAMVAAGMLAWGWQRVTGRGPLAEDRIVLIERGSGVARIAAELAGSGVVSDPYTFRAAVRLFAGDRPLRAGEYQFPAHLSPRQAVEQMLEGRVVQHRITVPEGLTSSQVIELLRAIDLLEGEVGAVPGEGSLLPETYQIVRGDRRDELVHRMQEAMTAAVAELWPKRRPGLPLASPADAVVLASIVEKETGVATERPRVAAVFLNRLDRGMRLQSDPTVIYGLTGGKAASVASGEGVLGRTLTRADLAQPGPYNTYVIDGLPPGPIANPGRDALQAVLEPLETDELYFVADGTGGHAFSRTLEEHNRNVARWRKIQGQGSD
jgi:UPF0755 protein